LQKIVMLDLADIIVVNKSDQDRARTAMSEIGRRVEQNRRGQRVLATVAKRHRDAGVDQLCDLLTQPMKRTAKKGQRK
jgi:methylmalonyl-CoA mutase